MDVMSRVNECAVRAPWESQSVDRAEWCQVRVSTYTAKSARNRAVASHQHGRRGRVVVTRRRRVGRDGCRRYLLSRIQLLRQRCIGGYIALTAHWGTKMQTKISNPSGICGAAESFARGGDNAAAANGGGGAAHHPAAAPVRTPRRKAVVATALRTRRMRVPHIPQMHQYFGRDARAENLR